MSSEMKNLLVFLVALLLGALIGLVQAGLVGDLTDGVADPVKSIPIVGDVLEGVVG